MNKKVEKNCLNLIQIKKFTSTQNIGPASIFLLGSASFYITGTFLMINGG